MLPGEKLNTSPPPTLCLSAQPVCTGHMGASEAEKSRPGFGSDDCRGFCGCLPSIHFFPYDESKPITLTLAILPAIHLVVTKWPNPAGWEMRAALLGGRARGKALGKVSLILRRRSIITSLYYPGPYFPLCSLYSICVQVALAMWFSSSLHKLFLLFLGPQSLMYSIMSMSPPLFIILIFLVSHQNFTFEVDPSWSLMKRLNKVHVFLKFMNTFDILFLNHSALYSLCSIFCFCYFLPKKI